MTFLKFHFAIFSSPTVKIQIFWGCHKLNLRRARFCSRPDLIYGSAGGYGNPPTNFAIRGPSGLKGRLWKPTLRYHNVCSSGWGWPPTLTFHDFWSGSMYSGGRVFPPFGLKTSSTQKHRFRIIACQPHERTAWEFLSSHYGDHCTTGILRP
jgi:hypothetical protein